MSETLRGLQRYRKLHVSHSRHAAGSLKVARTGATAAASTRATPAIADASRAGIAGESKGGRGRRRGSSESGRYAPLVDVLHRGASPRASGADTSRDEEEEGEDEDKIIKKRAREVNKLRLSGVRAKIEMVDAKRQRHRHVTKRKGPASKQAATLATMLGATITEETPSRRVDRINGDGLAAGVRKVMKQGKPAGAQRRAVRNAALGPETGALGGEEYKASSLLSMVEQGLGAFAAATGAAAEEDGGASAVDRRACGRAPASARDNAAARRDPAAASTAPRCESHFVTESTSRGLLPWDEPQPSPPPAARTSGGGTTLGAQHSAAAAVPATHPAFRRVGEATADVAALLPTRGGIQQQKDGTGAVIFSSGARIPLSSLAVLHFGADRCPTVASAFDPSAPVARRATALMLVALPVARAAAAAAAAAAVAAAALSPTAAAGQAEGATGLQQSRAATAGPRGAAAGLARLEQLSAAREEHVRLVAKRRAGGGGVEECAMAVICADAVSCDTAGTGTLSFGHSRRTGLVERSARAGVAAAAPAAGGPPASVVARPFASLSSIDVPVLTDGAALEAAHEVLAPHYTWHRRFRPLLPRDIVGHRGQRERYSAWLTARLRGDPSSPRACLLVGPSGCGKRSIVEAYARQAMARVLYADEAAQRTLGALVSWIQDASALGTRRSGGYGVVLAIDAAAQAEQGTAAAARHAQQRDAGGAGGDDDREGGTPRRSLPGAPDRQNPITPHSVRAAIDSLRACANPVVFVANDTNSRALRVMTASAERVELSKLSTENLKVIARRVAISLEDASRAGARDSKGTLGAGVVEHVAGQAAGDCGSGEHELRRRAAEEAVRALVEEASRVSRKKEERAWATGPGGAAAAAGADASLGAGARARVLGMRAEMVSQLVGARAVGWDARATTALQDARAVADIAEASGGDARRMLIDLQQRVHAIPRSAAASAGGSFGAGTPARGDPRGHRGARADAGGTAAVRACSQTVFDAVRALYSRELGFEDAGAAVWSHADAAALLERNIATSLSAAPRWDAWRALDAHASALEVASAVDVLGGWSPPRVDSSRVGQCAWEAAQFGAWALPRAAAASGLCAGLPGSSTRLAYPEECRSAARERAAVLRHTVRRAGACFGGVTRLAVREMAQLVALRARKATASGKASTWPGWRMALASSPDDSVDHVLVRAAARCAAEAAVCESGPGTAGAHVPDTDDHAVLATLDRWLRESGGVPAQVAQQVREARASAQQAAAIEEDNRATAPSVNRRQPVPAPASGLYRILSPSQLDAAYRAATAHDGGDGDDGSTPPSPGTPAGQAGISSAVQRAKHLVRHHVGNDVYMRWGLYASTEDDVRDLDNMATNMELGNLLTSHPLYAAAAKGGSLRGRSATRGGPRLPGTRNAYARGRHAARLWRGHGHSERSSYSSSSKPALTFGTKVHAQSRERFGAVSAHAPQQQHNA